MTDNKKILDETKKSKDQGYKLAMKLIHKEKNIEEKNDNKGQDQ